MSWKETLSVVAPTLATALGGPLAGTAANFIAKKLLGKDTATNEEIQGLIVGATPEQLADLKSLELDFKVKMKELGVEVKRLDNKDRADARDLAKVDMKPQVILSLFYTVGYFAMLFGILTDALSIPDGGKGQLVSGLIGVLTAMQIKIGDFWFGSSHGSKTKGKQ